jgi:hypothetical protein
MPVSTRSRNRSAGSSPLWASGANQAAIATPITAPASASTASSSAGRPARTLGHEAGDLPNGSRELPEHRCLQFGHAPHEPLALQLKGHLLARETPEAEPERGAQRLDRVELGWLRTERLDHALVEVVVDDEVRLGREVAEDGGGRDLGQLGDLLDGGLGVTLLAEQAQGVLLDQGTRLRLLAFAQA